MKLANSQGTSAYGVALSAPRRRWTVEGQAQLSTAWKKFGTSSLLISNPAYPMRIDAQFLHHKNFYPPATRPSSARLLLSPGAFIGDSQEFTVEFWFRPLTPGNVFTSPFYEEHGGTLHRGITIMKFPIFGGDVYAYLKEERRGVPRYRQWRSATNIKHLFQLIIVTQPAGRPRSIIRSFAPVNLSGIGAGGSHFATSVDSRSIKMYQDGRLLLTTDRSSALLAPQTDGRAALIGEDGSIISNTSSYYIDEFRVSKTARYPAPFSPPSAPFARDADTTLLMHFDVPDGSATIYAD